MLRQTAKRTCFPLIIAAAFSAIITCPVRGEVLLYREVDGTRWFSDHKLSPREYTLIGRYGRPTASASCKGISPAILERRSKAHGDPMRRYSRAYGVDPMLVKAMITVESCFDRYAVSRAGAKGLMQLMPATARSYGVSNPFDALQNMRAGIRLFSELLERYDEDTVLALAAYNAGPKAVDKHGGVPPYRETQDYVQRVRKYYERYKGEAIP